MTDKKTEKKKDKKRKKHDKRFTIRLSLMITGFIAVLLIIFAFLVDSFSYLVFNLAFKEEYDDSVYKVACTCTYFVDADKLDEFIESKGKSKSYMETKEILENLCVYLGASSVYVIRPDEDYMHYTAVFDYHFGMESYVDALPGEVRPIPNKKYVKALKKIYEDGAYWATADSIKDIQKGDVPHVTALIPLVSSDGSIKGIVIAEREVDELNYSKTGFALWMGIATVFFAIIAITIALIVMNKEVVKPLKLIEDEAEQFATNNETSERIIEGKISDVYEISNLADSVVEMEDDILDYIKNITDITKEKERIGTELSLAGKIQESALPNSFPPFPERKEFDVYASMSAAKEIGGDFYDFFLVDDDHIALVMADVSGKGIPGALFMMVSKILISEHTVSGEDPVEVFTQINKRICSNNKKTNMFVTAWLGILDIRTGIIRAVNAGHEDPVIYKNGESFELYKTKHGMPLGVRAKAQYTQHEIQLEKGDRIFLYTDGIPEADNEAGEMFGLDRMLDSLNEGRFRDIRGVIEKLTEDIGEFVGNAVQFDDMTMLCLEYNGCVQEET